MIFCFFPVSTGSLFSPEKKKKTCGKPAKNYRFKKKSSHCLQKLCPVKVGKEIAHPLGRKEDKY